MKLALWISTAVFALGASGHGALADAGHSHDDQYKMLQKMQEMHSGHGREVFLEKGCIVRHCVNGVSGEPASRSMRPTCPSR